MDSSQSHDPFRGEGQGELGEGTTTEETQVNELQFDVARWQRVGATEEQVAALQERWDGYTAEQKAQEDAWMKGTSDPDLQAYLQQGQNDGQDGGQATPPVEPQASADEHENAQQTEGTPPATDGAVTGAVVPPVEGQQPATTAEATGAEAQPATQGPAGTNVGDVPTGSAKDVENWVGTDKDRARAALEAEQAGEQRKGLTAHLERIVSE